MSACLTPDMHGTPRSVTARRLPGVAAWCLAALLALWPSAVGWLSPSDVGTHDQGKQVMYVVGALHGDLWVPRDRGVIATKPPLYTWIAAAIGSVAGLDETTVRLPSVLASIGLAITAFAFGARTLGTGPALVGLALFASTQHVAKLSYFARTDMLLSLFVALAIVAYAARRATGFWICVALGTLTKGPPGFAVPFAAVALHLAVTRDVERLRSLRVMRGLAIVAGLVTLWLVPALAMHFDDMRMMIREEFFEQLSGTGEYADVKHQPFFYLIPYLFLKLAPWSPALVFGLRDVGRNALATPRSSRDDGALLLACWLIGGLVVFLFPATKRPDHLLPMYVPAALLAGVALWPWMEEKTPPVAARVFDSIVRLWALGAGAFALVLLPATRLGATASYASPPGWMFGVSALALLPMAYALRPAATPRARLIAALAAHGLATLVFSHTLTAPAREADAPVMRTFASDVARHVGAAPILFIETHSIPLQFLLERNVPELPRDAVATTLARGDAPSWLITPEGVLSALAADPTVGDRVARWPIVARSSPRPSRGGAVLALVRIAPAAPGAAAAEETANGNAAKRPAVDPRETTNTDPGT